MDRGFVLGLMGIQTLILYAWLSKKPQEAKTVSFIHSFNITTWAPTLNQLSCYTSCSFCDL